jgi:hypothetical protein
MKKIVLFVEGDGEAEAMPKLVKRLLTEQNAWDTVILDQDVFRIGEVAKIVKDDFRLWKNKLEASLKRRNVGGVLLVLDGDVKKIKGKAFCAASVAKELAGEAKAIGGGLRFSVAVVFARQEYESWLIAGVASLADKSLPDGRVIASDAVAPSGDLEESPRGAKEWLGKVVEGGYKPTSDQATLTDLVDIDVIRGRKLRSFRRLESAISQLILAIRKEEHVVSPG